MVPQNFEVIMIGESIAYPCWAKRGRRIAYLSNLQDVASPRY